ncbi:MAG: hypothetical protein Q9187_001080 [Circinaria calcarea]
MDELLAHLLTFPPHPPPPQPLPDIEYDKQIRALVQLLNHTSASKLTSGMSSGDDLLDVLNPSINTLPYLHTLLAHIENAQNSKQSVAANLKAFSPSSELWRKMLKFMEHFDPIQVRYVGHEFRRLIDAAARVAYTASTPEIAIQPIRNAILRLDPSSSCFTSSHVLFAHLCLSARAFSSALPILDKDIFHFPSPSDKSLSLPLPCSDHDTSSTFITTGSGLSDKLVYKDYLKYFLYGAMLYLGVKNWERALLFLEIVIATPTNNTVSMVQVEAYKKYVLVGLLLEGKSLPMPPHTNHQAAKIYRATAKAYEALAEVFRAGIAHRLHDEARAGHELWQHDCNTGLVLQVLDALRRFAILRLGKTFAALSIPEVARRTSPRPDDYAETEHYLSSMIRDGHLNATITQSSDPAKPPVLRFASSTHSGPLARSEAQQYSDLKKQTADTTKLISHIKEADRKLELSTSYLEWARKARKSEEARENRQNSGGELHTMNDSFGVDEDMLADM